MYEHENIKWKLVGIEQRINGLSTPKICKTRLTLEHGIDVELSLVMTAKWEHKRSFEIGIH